MLTIKNDLSFIHENELKVYEAASYNPKYGAGQDNVTKWKIIIICGKRMLATKMGLLRAGLIKNLSTRSGKGE